VPDGGRSLILAVGKAAIPMMREALDQAGVAYHIVGDPTLFEVVFTEKKPRDYRDTTDGDASLTARWNGVLRENGIFKAPGKTYPCLALNEADLELTQNAIRKAGAALMG
jgi:glutamate-1-semialdehyde 2,1-aminomutase